MNSETIRMKMLKICNDVFQTTFDEELSTGFEYFDLVDDLGMDSIMFITLIVEIEDSFDIIIPDELILMENYKSVEDFMMIIEQSLNNHGEIVEDEKT